MADPQQTLDLPIDSLQPNPLQPRGKMDMEGIQELMASIVTHGVLEPLVVAHTPAGYQIVAGERRWKAAKMAGLATVPVIVKETSPRGMLEMALIENVQRVDLNPLDRAKAFQRLIEEFHLSTGEIADRIGKSGAYVSNTVRLLALPDALKDGLLSGAITEGHARALAAIGDTRLMVEAYKMVLKENASVRRAEDIARRMQVQIGYKPRMNSQAPLMVSPTIDRWQQKLQDSLGENAHVKLTRSRAQTKVVIILKGGPEETQSQLGRIMRVAGTARQA